MALVAASKQRTTFPAWWYTHAERLCATSNVNQTLEAAKNRPKKTFLFIFSGISSQRPPDYFSAKTSG